MKWMLHTESSPVIFEENMLIGVNETEQSISEIRFLFVQLLYII